MLIGEVDDGNRFREMHSQRFLREDRETGGKQFVALFEVSIRRSHQNRRTKLPGAQSIIERGKHRRARMRYGKTSARPRVRIDRSSDRSARLSIDNLSPHL